MARWVLAGSRAEAVRAWLRRPCGGEAMAVAGDGAEVIGWVANVGQWRRRSGPWQMCDNIGEKQKAG